MDTTMVILLKVALVFAVLLILAYLAYLAVIWAKRSSKGVEFVGSLIGSVDVATSLNPAQEVLREKRRAKRIEDGSGDPDELPE